MRVTYKVEDIWYIPYVTIRARYHKKKASELEPLIRVKKRVWSEKKQGV